MDSRRGHFLRALVAHALAVALFLLALTLAHYGPSDQRACAPVHAPSDNPIGCRRCVPQGYRYA